MTVSRLMVLISDTLAMPVREQVRHVQGSSASLIQYRAKSLCDEEWLQEARFVREMLPDVTLIINDNLEIARDVGDGVHLGDSDMAIDDALSVLPEGFLLGGTCHDSTDIMRKVPKCSYIGLGPYKATATKSNHKAPLLSEGLRQRMEAIRQAQVPVYLIGGVTSDDVRDLAHLPELSFCIGSGIFSSKNPLQEIDQILEFLT